VPTQPKLDANQFADRRQYPVSANLTADGWKSTGLDFSDYARMATHQRKPSGERRLPTPRWAIDNPMLQELLAEFFEERATCGDNFKKFRDSVPLPFTPRPVEERLASARRAVARHRQQQEQTLTELCKRFVQQEDRKAKRSLQIEIEALDTQLRCMATDGGVAKVAAIVVLYYRVGMDSPGVAEALALKPPHVRRTLFNMHQTAKRLGGRFLETA
jgi:predicted alpha/beta-hydrolase family hydrolase